METRLTKESNDNDIDQSDKIFESNKDKLHF